LKGNGCDNEGISSDNERKSSNNKGIISDNTRKAMIIKG
jgi:hypothetical protein